MTATCTRPPAGWQCSRPAGHDGPCAAPPDQDAERLASWLREGATELLNAHAVLDSLGAPRVSDDGFALTLASRIAKLPDTLAPALAKHYPAAPAVIAALCDEDLDPTGALLGRVRVAARAQREATPLCDRATCLNTAPHVVGSWCIG